LQHDLKKTPDAKEYTEEYYRSTCCGYFEEYLRGEIPLKHRKALQYLEVHPREVILDIGCGRGELIEACAGKGSKAIGIDYSSAAVKMAKNWKGNAVIIQGSATALPFGKEVFDKVVMLDVVEHLAPDDFLKCLEEVHRVLKKEGQIPIHTPNIWGDNISSLYFKVAFKFRTFLKRKKPSLGACPYSAFHVNVLSPVSLKRILRRGGFRSKIWFAGHPLKDTPYWWRTVDKILFFATSIWCKAYRS
jgi:2-polyprenyl-3-methyl-5-hydroxy-6-metoxy-1,4-benzoquinol methylase